MVEVLARPTNNAEQFCGRRKGKKFMCQHFTKFCAGLHVIYWFHWFNLNGVELILF